MKEREDSDVAESVSLLSPSPFPSPFPSLLSLFSLLVSSATRYRNRVRISTRPRQKGSTRWPWLASTFTRPVFRSRGTDAALFHVRRFQRSQQHAARASVSVCVCVFVYGRQTHRDTQGRQRRENERKRGRPPLISETFVFFFVLARLSPLYATGRAFTASCLTPALGSQCATGAQEAAKRGPRGTKSAIARGKAALVPPLGPCSDLFRWGGRMPRSR